MLDDIRTTRSDRPRITKARGSSPLGPIPFSRTGKPSSHDRESSRCLCAAEKPFEKYVPGVERCVVGEEPHQSIGSLHFSHRLTGRWTEAYPDLPGRR